VQVTNIEQPEIALHDLASGSPLTIKTDGPLPDEIKIELRTIGEEQPAILGGTFTEVEGDPPTYNWSMDDKDKFRNALANRLLESNGLDLHLYVNERDSGQSIRVTLETKPMRGITEANRVGREADFDQNDSTALKVVLRTEPKPDGPPVTVQDEVPISLEPEDEVALLDMTEGNADGGDNYYYVRRVSDGATGWVRSIYVGE
jgi:hypothetical protein